MTLRRLAFRIVLWFVIFLTLFSGALVVMFETGALTPYVVESLDARLAPAGLSFRAGSIHWRPWSGLGLSDVFLETVAVPSDSTGGPRHVVSFRRLDVGYRLIDLLRGDLRVARVQLIRPDIDLDALLDWSAALSGRPPSGGGASFRIDTIRISEGRVRARDHDALQDFSVRGSLEVAPGEWRLAIEQEKGRLTLGRFDEDVTVHGEVTLSRGMLHLDGVEIAAAGGTIVLNGRADPRDERPSDLVVHATSVPLEKVGEWLDVEHPLLFARLDCDAVVTGRADSLHVTADLTGRGHDDISRRIRLEGLRIGNRLKLDRFRYVAEPSRLELSGEVDFSAGPSIEGVAVFRDLDPAVLLADPDLVELGHLNGAVRFAGAGLTRATFRGRADVHIDGANAFGLPFGAGTLSGTLDRGSLEVESARFTVAGSELVGRGSIDRDNIVEAELHGDLADLAVLSRIGGAFRAAAPGGHGDVTVHVAGPVRTPELGATLRLQDTTIGGLEASQLEITAEALRLGATRVDFRAEGTGVGRNGRRFDRLTADGWGDSRSLVFRSIDLETDLAALSLAGRLDFGEQGRRDAIVERLSLRALDGSSAWENAGPVHVTRTPNAVEVAGLDLRGNGTVAGAVTVLPSGATSFRAEGRAVDLKLFAPFLTSGAVVGGLVDFDGSGVVGADTLGADMRLTLANGRFGGRVVDALSGHVVLDDSVTLDEVSLATPELRASISGVLMPPPGTLRDALFDRDARTRALERTEIRGLAARIETSDFTWLWNVIPKAPVTAGAGGVNVRIDGPFLGPTAHLDAEVTGGAIGSEPLDSFTVEADFDGEVLSIHDGLLKTGKNSATIDGVVPLEWTAAEPRPRLRAGREVDLHLAAAGLPLESLSSTISLFTNLHGTADAHLALKGVPGALHFSGDFSVTDGRLTIPTFDEPLVDGKGRGTFDAQGIDVSSATFSDGHGGVLDGHGRILLENLHPTDYTIDLVARDYHYRSDLIDTRAIGSGTMQILARTTVDGRLVPFYQGKFRVSRADIGPKALTPPGAESAGAGPDLPPGVVAPPEPQAVGPGGNLVTLPVSREAQTPVLFLAEIGLKGDRNLWLKTPEMDLELSGDVVFHANERGMGLSGEVSTLRGTYSVLNSRFSVDRATVEFTDPNDPDAAYIDAQASTTVLDENITAYATGSVIEPNIRLETQSGMSEAEIYELLALRVKRNDATTGQQEGAISSAFRRSYVAALTNRFGSELGRELGLDTFDYQQGDSGARSSVTVGKNVGRDFFFKYRQAVGSASDPSVDPSVTREALDSPERALTVEYRLSRIFMLQGETGTVPPGDDYLNVDLKAEWGY